MSRTIKVDVYRTFIATPSGRVPVIKKSAFGQHHRACGLCGLGRKFKRQKAKKNRRASKAILRAETQLAYLDQSDSAL